MITQWSSLTSMIRWCQKPAAALSRIRAALSAFALVGCVAVATSGCLGAAYGDKEQLRPLTLPNGTRILVEVAATPAARVRGLMYRTTLPKDRGMLFVFDSADRWGIWMKNTYIPLDVIWLDHDHRIVDIVEGLKPCVTNLCPIYRPAKNAWYALEISVGQSKHEGLRPGMTLTFQYP